MNGLFLAASGAASQLQALDISAHNLANSGTPGFRRFELVADAVSKAPSPFEYAAVEASTPRLDMAQGPLRDTGNPLDIAVVGPGFIRVQGPDGEAYTRDGQLQVSSDGALLAAGYPVMRDGGGSITLPAGDITIAADGSITVNGQPNARIGIADPKGAAMTPAGGSLYRSAEGDPLPASETGTEIRQGFLEDSGGNPITGVVEMLRIMRGYESAMRAVQTIDQSQEKTIQALTVNA